MYFLTVSAESILYVMVNAPTSSSTSWSTSSWLHIGARPSQYTIYKHKCYSTSLCLGVVDTVNGYIYSEWSQSLAPWYESPKLDLRWEGTDFKGTWGACFSPRRWLVMWSRLLEIVMEAGTFTLFKGHLDNYMDENGLERNGLGTGKSD